MGKLYWSSPNFFNLQEMYGIDTGKSLRKTGISPSGEIPSCPHNALLEILSRNHARVVPDGFLRDLPVSTPTHILNKIGR